MDKQKKKFIGKTVAALRRKADELEQLDRIAEEATEYFREEERFMRPEYKTGVASPWDARHTGKPGGYDYVDGTNAKPCRTVSGKRWETLCVCHNVEAAKFITHAINEYLKTVQPEIMFVEKVDKKGEVLLGEKALRKLREKWDKQDKEAERR